VFRGAGYWIHQLPPAGVPGCDLWEAPSAFPLSAYPSKIDVSIRQR